MNQSYMGKPPPEDIKMLDGLRRGLMPLVAVIGGMQHELATRPELLDWPSIHRNISAINSSLTSLQTYLNIGTSATANPPRSGVPPAASALKSLRPYPIPPFQADKPNFVGLTNHLLRKKLEPSEESWVLDRLATAAEFAHVPNDWNVEPRKPKVDEKKEDSDDEEDRDDPDEKGRGSFKRQKGNLDEDQLSELWSDARTIAEGQLYNVMRELYPEFLEEDKSEDESEDAEMRDASDGADVGGRGPRPVPQPMMSLGTVHRFMTIGTIDQPSVL